MKKIESYDYQEYMKEYTELANSEMKPIMEASYKDNYYYRDNLLIPLVAPILAKASNREKIIDFTGDFISSHSKQLSTPGPIHMFTFADKEINFLYDLFDITKEKILEISKNMFIETYNFHTMIHIVREAPHKVLMTAIIIDSLQKGYEDVVTCCEYLLGFSEYPLIYRHYWKNGVQEPVMNYTIEHIARKYKIINKNLNNLKDLLKYDMTLCVTVFTDKLKDGKDNTYVDFIFRVRTQINSTFRNIAREYYKNQKNNATQYTKSGTMDDGTLSDQDGYNTNLSSTVENTYDKIMSSGIELSWLGVAAEGNKVDLDNLRSYINKIFTTKDNRIYQFIENVITAYFMKNPTDTSVGSAEFFSFGLDLYKSIATSKVEVYKELRIILNYWIDDIINISEYYPKGGTTVRNYSRAIFNYMVFIIKHHNS